MRNPQRAKNSYQIEGFLIQHQWFMPEVRAAVALVVVPVVGVTITDLFQTTITIATTGLQGPFITGVASPIARAEAAKTGATVTIVSHTIPVAAAKLGVTAPALPTASHTIPAEAAKLGVAGPALPTASRTIPVEAAKLGVAVPVPPIASHTIPAEAAKLGVVVAPPPLASRTTPTAAVICGISSAGDYFLPQDKGNLFETRFSPSAT